MQCVYGVNTNIISEPLPRNCNLLSIEVLTVTKFAFKFHFRTAFKPPSLKSTQDIRTVPKTKMAV